MRTRSWSTSTSTTTARPTRSRWPRSWPPTGRTSPPAASPRASARGRWRWGGCSSGPSGRRCSAPRPSVVWVGPATRRPEGEEGRLALSARSAVTMAGTTRRAEAVALIEAPSVQRASRGPAGRASAPGRASGRPAHRLAPGRALRRFRRMTQRTSGSATASQRSIAGPSRRSRAPPRPRRSTRRRAPSSGRARHRGAGRWRAGRPSAASETAIARRASGAAAQQRRLGDRPRRSAAATERPSRRPERVGRRAAPSPRDRVGSALEPQALERHRHALAHAPARVVGAARAPAAASTSSGAPRPPRRADAHEAGDDQHHLGRVLRGLLRRQPRPTRGAAGRRPSSSAAARAASRLPRRPGQARDRRSGRPPGVGRRAHGLAVARRPLPTDGALVEELPQPLRVAVGVELVERLGLDLADALARDAEPLADLLEGAGLLAAEAEAELQDLALAVGEL